jgi:hypothetical protein
MDDDPPFVSVNDAEALRVSEQMFGFQGQLYKFPLQVRNPQFREINYSLVRK